MQLKHFADTYMIPMPDLEVEIILLNLNALNSQDPQIQYTIGYENDKRLNILDVKIRNKLNQSYDFAVHRKPVITNFKKPHTFQHMPKHSYESN